MVQQTALQADLVRAGYYPELVAEVLELALADEEVVAHFVHQETTFDSDEVRRHITVLVLTPSRFVVAHVDDHVVDGDQRSSQAAATTEIVPLSAIRTVALSNVVRNPLGHRTGTPPLEVTLALSWGSVSRIDIEPAACPDPECSADHGYTGTQVPEDLVVRVSAEAEGDGAVTSALQFARAVSAATVGTSR